MRDRLQPPKSVRRRRDHRPMWIVKVICSDPDCAEEQEIIVAELNEADAAVCGCGCCTETLAVANFEPLALSGSSPPR
jgi:hypothetical protein